MNSSQSSETGSEVKGVCSEVINAWAASSCLVQHGLFGETQEEAESEAWHFPGHRFHNLCGCVL